MNKILLKLLHYCFLIEAQTKHVTFFDYSGHVSKINIHVSESADSYCQRLFDEDCWMQEDDVPEAESLLALMGLQEQLENFMDSIGISYRLAYPIEI